MTVKHYIATLHVLIRLDDSISSMCNSQAAACDAVSEWLREADEFMDWGYAPYGSPVEVTVDDNYQEGDIYKYIK